MICYCQSIGMAEVIFVLKSIGSKKKIYAQVDRAKATITPICCRSDRDWLVERLLVITSTTLSAVDIFSSPSFPFFTQSQMK